MPEHSSRTAAADFLERLAVGALLLTPVLPLIFAPGVVFPYVTIRAVLFRALVLLAAWCAAVLILSRRTAVGWRGDVTALALAAVFGTAAISAFAGPATWHSWFGDFERMGGVVTWLAYLAYYLLLLRFLRRDTWRGFLQLAAVAGAIAAVFAWFEYFGAFTHMGYGARAATSSTIGNSGLFAPYMAFAAAFSLLLFAEAGTRRTRALYGLLATLHASGIWLAQNRSTVIGVVAGTVVAALAYMAFMGWSRRRLAIAVALTVIAIGASAIALRTAARAELLPALPGVTSRLASAAAGGDPSRIVQWRATWSGFTQRPAFGWGPENQHLVWSANYAPAMYGIDPLSRWDRAHNAYLEALATTGIPGALATLALWIAIFVTIFRARARGGLSPPAAAVLIGINVAYAVYLFFWFYDVNSTMLWIATAAFASSRTAHEARGFADGATSEHIAPPMQPVPPAAEEEAAPPHWRKPALIALTTVAAVAILYVHAFETLRAAHAIERLAASPPPLTRGIGHLRVLGRSPAPQSLELFTAASSYLAIAFRRDTLAIARGDTAPPALRREAVAIALRLAERELQRDPRDERVALHAARVALLGAGVYQDRSLYDLAVRLGDRAVDLNPQNVRVRLVLANFLLLGGDRRRAEEQFRTAAQIFPAYLEPRRTAVLSYAAMGAYTDAARWLQTAQEGGATVEPQLVTRIVRGAQANEFGSEALAALRGHVRLRLGPSAFWSPAVTTSGATVSQELEQAELLAELELAYGSPQSARAAAMAVEHICPRRPCRSLLPLDSLPQF